MQREFSEAYGEKEKEKKSCIDFDMYSDKNISSTGSSSYTTEKSGKLSTEEYYKQPQPAFQNRKHKQSTSKHMKQLLPYFLYYRIIRIENKMNLLIFIQIH